MPFFRSAPTCSCELVRSRSLSRTTDARRTQLACSLARCVLDLLTPSFWLGDLVLCDSSSLLTPYSQWQSELELWPRASYVMHASCWRCPNVFGTRQTVFSFSVAACAHRSAFMLRACQLCLRIAHTTTYNFVVSSQRFSASAAAHAQCLLRSCACDVHRTGLASPGLSGFALASLKQGTLKPLLPVAALLFRLLIELCCAIRSQYTQHYAMCYAYCRLNDCEVNFALTASIMSASLSP